MNRTSIIRFVSARLFAGIALAACSAGLLLGLAMLCLGMLAGCSKPEAAPPKPLPTADELLARLDATIDRTQTHRKLSVPENAAWQIMHGVLPYKLKFQIWDGDKQVFAVQYLLEGGEMEGWQLYPGNVPLKYTGSERIGIRAIVPESRNPQDAVKGQGHVDQWLAILSACQVPSTQKLMVRGQEFLVQDWVSQAMWDVATNPFNEYSWTILSLSHYLGPDAKWIASDGQEWSIERLLELETAAPVNGAACGGTHRLSGLCLTVARHLKNGGKLEGAWLKADERVKQHIEIAKQYQHDDGSLSTNFFISKATSADNGAKLYSTGHTLEFMGNAMTAEQLKQPWVKRSLVALLDLFDATENVSELDCGQLYHAANALVIYRNKVFGPRQ